MFRIGETVIIYREIYRNSFRLNIRLVFGTINLSWTKIVFRILNIMFKVINNFGFSSGCPVS